MSSDSKQLRIESNWDYYFEFDNEKDYIKMENFDGYYHERFRLDLNTFLMSIPEENRYHNGADKTTFTIQYERLSKDFNHLDFLISDSVKSYFGIALFFTVLIDEVFYTYYQSDYENFRKLTLYPKFIGNCPSSCHYHFDPIEIFSAMNYSRENEIKPSNKYRIDFIHPFEEAVPIMKRETFDFFHRYMNNIQASEFWAKCINEFPYSLKNMPI